MVFYAYTYSRDDSHGGHLLMVAPCVEDVDRWFRYTNENGHKIDRNGPELYGYDYAANWPFDKIQAEEKSGLRNKIMFAYTKDRGSFYHHMFPNQFAPDHISGKTFYIRSKAHPHVFWSVDGGSIFASKHSRTKFRVKTTKEVHGGVMIPDDKVTITALIGKDGDLGEYSVVSENGALFVGGAQSGGGGGGGLVRSGHNFSLTSAEFDFGDFKTGFTPVGKEGEEADAKIMYVRGVGDEWELVK